MLLCVHELSSFFLLFSCFFFLLLLSGYQSPLLLWQNLLGYQLLILLMNYSWVGLAVPEVALSWTLLWTYRVDSRVLLLLEVYHIKKEGRWSTYLVWRYSIGWSRKTPLLSGWYLDISMPSCWSRSKKNSACLVDLCFQLPLSAWVLKNFLHLQLGFLK